MRSSSKMLGLLAMAAMLENGINRNVGVETPIHKRDPRPEWERKICKSCVDLKSCNTNYKGNPQKPACKLWTKRK